MFLKDSINSIQRQTLKDIEIIAVNDCSTDNTLKLLKKLAKKDKRIKVINNDRNHGLLYSRAMGILNSTGQYVMNLDPDDQFINENVLKFLFYKSRIFKLDLIEFLLQKFNIKYIKFLNEFLLKLKHNHYNSNNITKIDILITNKFIKKDIIIKAYNCYKTKIYGNKWNYHEDHIWHFLINKYAKSKLCIYKYLYLYLINRQSLMNNRRISLEVKNSIYKFEMNEKLYNEKSFPKLKALLKMIKNYFLYSKNIDIEIKNKFIHIYAGFCRYYSEKKKIKSL